MAMGNSKGKVTMFKIGPQSAAKVQYLILNYVQRLSSHEEYPYKPMIGYDFQGHKVMGNEKLMNVVRHHWKI